MSITRLNYTLNHQPQEWLPYSVGGTVEILRAIGFAVWVLVLVLCCARWVYQTKTDRSDEKISCMVGNGRRRGDGD